MFGPPKPRGRCYVSRASHNAQMIESPQRLAAFCQILTARKRNPRAVGPRLPKPSDTRMATVNDGTVSRRPQTSTSHGMTNADKYGDNCSARNRLDREDDERLFPRRPAARRTAPAPGGRTPSGATRYDFRSCLVNIHEGSSSFSTTSLTPNRWAAGDDVAPFAKLIPTIVAGVGERARLGGRMSH